ncbi:MAG TPA: hypothetical protein DDW52_24305 [Planctomycetaceae bacterium]|nr:hypothetical protein [Planctomycetaceae bacterium]
MLHNTMPNNPTRRSGFTLLELILSLSLIVVVAGLVSQLLQLYAQDFATRGDEIRRQQLARSLLRMIAQDVRSVVVEQEYDTSVLETLLGSSSSGGGSIPADAGDSVGFGSGLASDSGSGLGSGSGSSGAGGSAAGGSGIAGGGTGSGLADGTSSTDSPTDLVTSRPLGIYGDQFSLMVDVSQVPRFDEYQGEQNNIMTGALADIPGDIKSVTYYVQSATMMGVADSMASLTRKDQTEVGSQGLIRRAIDRRLADYAEESGNLQALDQTGDVVAPEVVSLEFSYFDGAEWMFEWDGEQQGLPWLVQIMLAIQSAEKAKEFPMQPGVSASQMSLLDRQAYGIEMYELIVAIPGAQLQTSGAASADAAAGMDSVGL